MNEHLPQHLLKKTSCTYWKVKAFCDPLCVESTCFAVDWTMLLRDRVAFFISHVICCWWCRRVRPKIYRIIRTLKSKSKIRVLDFDISLQIKKNMSYILYFIRQNTCTWLHNLVKLDHITRHATEPREQFDGTYRLYKRLEPREQTGT